MKTRIQILAECEYLTRTDVMVMLNCSRRTAVRIFQEADRIDREELKFRAEPSRVRKETVERVTGKKCKDMLDRIKKAGARQDNPQKPSDGF